MRSYPMSAQPWHYCKQSQRTPPFLTMTVSETNTGTVKIPPHYYLKDQLSRRCKSVLFQLRPELEHFIPISNNF